MWKVSVKLLLPFPAGAAENHQLADWVSSCWTSLPGLFTRGPRCFKCSLFILHLQGFNTLNRSSGKHERYECFGASFLNSPSVPDRKKQMSAATEIILITNCGTAKKMLLNQKLDKNNINKEQQRGLDSGVDPE